MSHRPGRLAEAIKQEVAQMLREELKDPRLGFATVTRVDVSPDLRYAKIFISVLGDEEEQASTIKALERAAGFVRSELGRRIRLRYTPEIAFKLDQSIAQGSRVLQLLNKVMDGSEDDGQS